MEAELGADTIESGGSSLARPSQWPRLLEFPFPVRNAVRRWRGMLGMVIGVGFALGLVLTMMGLIGTSMGQVLGDFGQSGANMYVAVNGGRLVVLKGSDTPGTIDHATAVLSKIRSLPGVRAAVGQLSWSMKQESEGPQARNQPTQFVPAMAVGGNKPTPQPATPAATATLLAHGTIEPAAQATIATMNGGVVRSLAVKVGETVGAQQEIAEISTPMQTDILVAPWTGTVMGLSAHLGDTLMPGAAVATIGDLSRYQVETNDVDEYLISQIQPGQQVAMTVEALDGRKLEGTVDTVALAQQTSSGGVTNYPVVIRLLGSDPDVRPGMAVRIVFSPKVGPS